ncbi:MAG TPA: class I SAM-dependent methyltransferase [Ignavibacteria bacterium]|nr:class I SAM-dependent methyltransferase [Ignavibacteria bacterium]
MSTSNWQNISYNIDIIKRLDPKSILDVGVGFGRWGILFREFLEVWGDNNITGEWKRVIDGVEIFPDYIKSYHKFFYDNIYIEDAYKFVKETRNRYELINCGDIIEHFEKKTALEFLDLCLKKSNYVLINIPIGPNWQQEGVNNNEYERHRSIWTVSEFKKYRHYLIKNFKDIEMRDFSVILLSNNKIDLTSSYGKFFNAKNILKNKIRMGKVVSLIEKRNQNK